MQAFKDGDRVFLQSGEEAVYVAPAGNRHVVRLVFEETGDDGGPEIGEPQVVNAVYARAPTVKLDAEIAELTKRRDALRESLAAAARDLAAARAAEERLKTRMQRHAALDRVLDFMEGRFTHFVVESWAGFQIVERGKALDDGDRTRWNGDMKLLTLFGMKDGGLAWRLNDYRDGSGDWKTVIPCQSIEEAREVAQRGFLKLWTDARRSTEQSLKMARECGVEVPPVIIEQFRAAREEYARNQVAQAEQRLEAARAALQVALA